MDKKIILELIQLHEYRLSNLKKSKSNWAKKQRRACEHKLVTLHRMLNHLHVAKLP